MTNDDLISLLHQLVDNLGPILDRLDSNTVPSLRVTLNEAAGRTLLLTAGIEFDRPVSSKQVPATIVDPTISFNMGRVLP
jgi:hypothetical protein